MLLTIRLQISDGSKLSLEFNLGFDVMCKYGQDKVIKGRSNEARTKLERRLASPLVSIRKRWKSCSGS
jgi:hypothetical protein